MPKKLPQRRPLRAQPVLPVNQKPEDDPYRTDLAFSATNIVFTHDGKLLLGTRSTEPVAIPEAGSVALIGGFNGYKKTELKTPTMFAALADKHLEEQIGVTIRPNQSSDFLPCEYDMNTITKPLNSPQGPKYIKRVAFDRIVQLDEAQTNTAKAKGKLKGLHQVTEQEFEALVATGKISFPFQVDHVREAFEIIRRGEKPSDMTVGWVKRREPAEAVL